jgi:HEAT repeat protein
MLTTDQLRRLARASIWLADFEGELATKPYDERIRDLALDALGRPDDETIVTSALSALDDDDRTVRVAALRVLRWHLDDDQVAAAVLRATHDPARRARRIAVQLSALLVDRPGVAERLREIVDDPDETTKISGTALSSLAGNIAAGSPGSGLRSVSDLLQSDSFRERILLLLLQQRPDDSVHPLLHEVVRGGTKAEAIAATRALCGMRIVNLAHFPPDERKRIQATYDPVDLSFISGRAYTKASLYWVPA